MSRTGTSLATKTAKHRFKRGEMTEVVVPVTKAKASGYLEIAAGDMVFLPPTNSKGLTAGVAYPNSALAVASIASVADWFLGVALDTSANGDSDDIAVATEGIFEFDLKASTSGTVKVGNAAILGALGETGDGGNSVDCFHCSVEAGYDGDGVFNETNRIGTVVSKGTSQTTVLVKIKSRVMFGNSVS